MKRFKLNQTGDTIIEVMLSLVVLGLILGSVTTLAGRSTSDLQTTSEHSVAQRVAQTQLEYLRQYVYANASSLGSDPILTNASGFCMAPQSDGSYKPALITDPYCAANSSSNSNYHILATVTSETLLAGQTSYLVTFHISWDGLSSNTNSMDLSQRLYEPVPVTNTAVIPIVPPTSCPAGYVGTPPNCTTITCPRTTYVAFAIDHSQSMLDRMLGPINREMAAQTAAKNFLDGLQMGGTFQNEVSISQFAGITGAQTLVPMTTNKNAAIAGINSIVAETQPWHTNVGGGIYNAQQAIDAVPGLNATNSNRAIVFVSDGVQSTPADFPGGWPLQDAYDKADAARAEGMEVYGLGIALNSAAQAFFLRLVGNDPTKYLNTTSPTAMANFAKQIGADLTCEGKSTP